MNTETILIASATTATILLILFVTIIGKKMREQQELTNYILNQLKKQNDYIIEAIKKANEQEK